MAYVDQAFSITDDDLMMDDYSFSYTVSNRPPIKEIAFAVSLLVFGILVIVSGIFMSLYKVGGDHAHGQYSVLFSCDLNFEFRIVGNMSISYQSSFRFSLFS